MMPMLMLLKMGSWAKGWCGGKSGWGSVMLLLRRVVDEGVRVKNSCGSGRR